MARAMPGLIKSAQIIPLTPTVGDAMRDITALDNIMPWEQHALKQQIVNTGLPVTAPASRLGSIGLGAAIGSTIGSAFENNSLIGGALGRFAGINGMFKSLGAVAGGLYGNIMYNKAHPDPHHRHGSNVYTY